MWPVGEEREITFWVDSFRVFLPIMLNVAAAGLLLLYAWTLGRLDKSDVKPVSAFIGQTPVDAAWDAFCGAKAESCACFLWLPPLISLLMLLLARVITIVSRGVMICR